MAEGLTDRPPLYTSVKGSAFGAKCIMRHLESRKRNFFYSLKPAASNKVRGGFYWEKLLSVDIVHIAAYLFDAASFCVKGIRLSGIVK